MADEDEIDILGDFSINSASSAIESELSASTHNRQDNAVRADGASWNPSPREMNVQREIDEDYSPELDHVNVPNYIQEEILIDNSVPGCIDDVMTLVNTAQPTIPVYPCTKQTNISLKKKSEKPRVSLLKPNIVSDIRKTKQVGITKETVLYCEDDFLIGSTESIGGSDSDEEVNPQVTVMPKLERKQGNHRRKNTSSTSVSGSKGRNPSKFNISVSMKRSKKKEMRGKSRGGKSEVAKDAAPSSPRLQIVFSSGQALPVSEGEQVIKIEKKTPADSESDVDIDVDSADEATNPAVVETKEVMKRNTSVEFKTRFIERKFEPMRPRQRKVNLMQSGDGGCTIMHTESGDLIEVVPEPRRERAPRLQPIQLFHCKHYTPDKPAPCAVRVQVSALVLMDAHAHGSRAEVMGLLGGELRGRRLAVRAYAAAAAAADCFGCDMCPVSQAQAAEELNAQGHAVVGWHHSHPRFVAQPSLQDLRTQLQLQRAAQAHCAPFVSIITSQHWARGRVASHYRCLRVEQEGAERREAGYQLRVRLVADVAPGGVPELLRRLRQVTAAHRDPQYRINMPVDVCPDAGVTYLEKCISSVSHHLISAGYSEQDSVFQDIVKGIRDIYR